MIFDQNSDIEWTIRTFDEASRLNDIYFLSSSRKGRRSEVEMQLEAKGYVLDIFIDGGLQKGAFDFK